MLTHTHEHTYLLYIRVHDGCYNTFTLRDSFQTAVRQNIYILGVYTWVYRHTPDFLNDGELPTRFRLLYVYHIYVHTRARDILAEIIPDTKTIYI